MKRTSKLLRGTARAFVALAMLGAAQWAFAQSFNDITPTELTRRLESASKPMLLDIQVEKDFAQHHRPGAVPTYAYPAKSDAQRAKLQPIVSKILASKEEVVIVCPGGGSGAKNTYTFLQEQGVPGNRIRILESGQKGWPYPEMVTKAK